MSILVLLAVAVLSVSGGCLAVLEPRMNKRVASIASAAASIASLGCFIRLVQVYNSRPLSVVMATGNPIAGLGPWDLLAMLLGVAAIIASVLGGKKALMPLLASSILMFSYTLLTVSFWD
jgi:hypothetical protein